MNTVSNTPISTSDSEGMRYAKLALFIQEACDNAGIGYTLGGYLQPIALSDSEGLRFAKLGAWLTLLADNISGGSSGTGNSGVDPLVTSVADLAALSMVGISLPQIKVWVNTATLTSEIWQAISSSAASNPSEGIQRSDDWASTNAVWFKR